MKFLKSYPAAAAAYAGLVVLIILFALVWREAFAAGIWLIPAVFGVGLSAFFFWQATTVKADPVNAQGIAWEKIPQFQAAVILAVAGVLFLVLRAVFFY